LHKAWYTIGDNLNKYFFTCARGTIDAAAWEVLPCGPLTILFCASDTAGNEVCQDVVVVKQAADLTALTLGIAIGGVCVVIAIVGITLAIKKKRGGNFP